MKPYDLPQGVSPYFRDLICGIVPNFPPSVILLDHFWFFIYMVACFRLKSEIRRIMIAIEAEIEFKRGEVKKEELLLCSNQNHYKMDGCDHSLLPFAVCVCRCGFTVPICVLARGSRGYTAVNKKTIPSAAFTREYDAAAAADGNCNSDSLS